MDIDWYAILLPAAIASSALSVISWWLFKFSQRHSVAANMVARLAGLAGIIAAGVAIYIHWTQGHPPGTNRSLGIKGFVFEHPVLLVCIVAGFSVLARSGHYSNRIERD